MLKCEECLLSHHRLVAPAKKTFKRGKRHNVVHDIAAQNKTSKIDQASARTHQPTAINQRGGIIICVFRALKVYKFYKERPSVKACNC
jgi:hypothetical protein